MTLDFLRFINVQETVADKVILTLFIMSVSAFFHTFSSKVETNVYKLSHPLETIRVNYVMRSIEGWCNENLSSLSLTISDYDGCLNALIEATWSPVNPAWYSQCIFLSSPPGIEYIKRLEKHDDANSRFANAIQKAVGFI